MVDTYAYSESFGGWNQVDEMHVWSGGQWNQSPRGYRYDETVPGWIKVWDEDAIDDIPKVHDIGFQEGSGQVVSDAISGASWTIPFVSGNEFSLDAPSAAPLQWSFFMDVSAAIAAQDVTASYGADTEFTATGWYKMPNGSPGTGPWGNDLFWLLKSGFTNLLVRYGRPSGSPYGFTVTYGGGNDFIPYTVSDNEWYKWAVAIGSPGSWFYLFDGGGETVASGALTNGTLVTGLLTGTILLRPLGTSTNLSNTGAKFTGLRAWKSYLTQDQIRGEL